MQAQRHELPPLDLLRGFESVARHLSFTRAAAELFLTQSAVSRQVQTLEEAIGVVLFQRRHRALVLTDAGERLYRKTADLLDELRETVRDIRGADQLKPLTVTTTFSFASLWLIPRLPRFRAEHPEVAVRISADNQVQDLTRDRIEVAIRYCAPDAAPAGAIMLFGEELMPMCSPELLRDRSRPLRKPEDLRQHILLHDDWNPGEHWMHWDTWLQSFGMAELKPAGDVRFSHYDQMIQAAIDGQGVALGRLPLLSGLIKRRKLVAPFEPRKLSGQMPTSSRSFFVFCEARAASRREVQAFCEWLVAEARGEVPRTAATEGETASSPARKPPPARRGL